ncbi:exodeoxyribonuclease VII large subunit [Patulibacter defluvii]|uniref:exodeoxyribonuclease VII large subunit n=1 Tax=Patulibacter defluvii TaxID=3095358 RepID=UPI002A752C78|nr:exodeoxyribonuclease VII large subunit [Patulibacter sp. DM4]
MSTVPEQDTTTISVSDYAARIGRALRAAGAAVVEGEVQRPKAGGRGVWWFDLSDGEQVLPCSYLPWLVRGRRDGPAHAPAHGDRVRVHVRHSEYWGAGGRLRVVVEEIEAAGEGELLRRRAALIARLTDEGLCDPARFPALPRFPRAVGLIAGRDSDALHDVLRGLRDRFPAAAVVTACCRVQGAAAPGEVIDRLARLDADPRVDVIVVARGGGSVQDLVCFDDERLCRAIRAIATPVVTAIGHTENNPVCNHVTHAAFVPRHAAERVVPDRRALVGDLDRAGAELTRAARAPQALRRELDARSAAVHARGRLDARRATVLDAGRTVDARADRFLRDHHTALAALRGTVDRAPDRLRAAAAQARQRLDAAAVGPLADRALSRLRRDVAARAAVLDAGDPRRRGWLVATGPDGRAIRRAAELRPGDALRLHLQDGHADARVSAVDADETKDDQ